MAKFVNEIRNRRQKCRKNLKTKCCVVKNHRSTENYLKRVSRNLYGIQKKTVLDNIKLVIRLVEDTSKSLNLYEILHLVNPHPIIEYHRENLPEQEPHVKHHTDILFSRGIDLCYIFEELMRNFGWKVGDTLDIENDICDVAGKLMMQVAEQDRPSLLDCMQIAVFSIQAQGSEQNGDKLRSLLIKKKKYNGLNLACILLEQMILDNKDNNVYWMRIVCIQFIDLICQLIFQPVYQEDVRWTLNYFVKLESAWSIQNIYNLIRNGLLMFHLRQDIFYQYLKIIRNFAIHPSVNVCQSNPNATKSLKCILHCRDEDKWRSLDNEVYEEEEDKSLNQVLKELTKDEVGQDEQHSARMIIENSNTIMKKYIDDYKGGIEQELEHIRNSERKDGIEVLSSCLAATSMALNICKGFLALNTQLVSYCLLVGRDRKDRGRLLEIVTGEGKSCVIAMVAATYALLGRTVNIVTSSPVLSQLDAGEWRKFYETLRLDADCNVEENRGDNQWYECPIVYGTFETCARDILRNKCVIPDEGKGRIGGIVIVDEVDSMLIDQGVLGTCLSHDLASIEMSHFEPVLALIWMHVSRLITIHGEFDIPYYVTEPEVFFVTFSRLRPEIGALPILRLAENDALGGIKEGFTDAYFCANIEDQKRLLRGVDVTKFFKFADEHIQLTRYDYFSRYKPKDIANGISILAHEDGLTSIVFSDHSMEKRLKEMITDALSDKSETRMGLPSYLRKDCIERLEHWITNAFRAKQMKYGREYIIENNAIYPEINKKWGDGLQQFLEMKHGLPCSPLSLNTNFLSYIDFFERYGSNIVGVAGTLGYDWERQFMDDTFSVEFATIPTSKRRKAFELDGRIMKNKYQWEFVISNQVESATANERAVLIICEDIATANYLHNSIASKKSNSTIYVWGKCASNDENHSTKVLKPKDVVLTSNLGARGTDFVTDEIVNKNGGLFVLVTFIPINDRVEKQAFGRTGRRGATGSYQILVNRERMQELLRECETVDEAKRLRDSIEKHRLKKTIEVNMTDSKHVLFREYCEIKKRFVTSSNCDSDDLKIQIELLDETYAKWIQRYEARLQESNYVEMAKTLRHIIEKCSIRATHFSSENIYILLKFGAVRLMKGDFEEATAFYDQVICKDPAWSAFAYYNRAYCTIQLKSDGYIRRAIDDLKATLCKLEIRKNKLLFSETFKVKNTSWISDVKNDSTYETNIKSSMYKIMMECQLLHHIDTQIIKTMNQLERIDTNNEDVKTYCRDILDLIPNFDSMTEELLEDYRQLGWLFSFNIKETPKFCYKTEIISSLVMLDAVSNIVLRLEFQGTSVNVYSKFESKYISEFLCNLGIVNEDSISWISRCFLAAVTTGINSITFMRDVSSMLKLHGTVSSLLEPSCFARFSHKQDTLFETTPHTDKNTSSLLEPSWLAQCSQEIVFPGTTHYMTEYEDMLRSPSGSTSKNKNSEVVSPLMMSSQSSQFTRDQARNVLTSLSLSNTLQDMKKMIGLKEDETTLHMNNVAMSLSDEKIKEALHEKMKPGETFHQTLCALYDSVTSQFRSDLQQFASCIRDLAQISVYSSQSFDAVFQTVDLENIAEVDISTLINTISDGIANEINSYIRKIKAVGYFSDDGPMLKETNKVLAFVWSDIIRSLIEIRIVREFLFDAQEITMRLFSLIYAKLSNKIMTKYRRPSLFSSTSSKTDFSSESLKTYHPKLSKTDSLSKSFITYSNYSKVSEEMSLCLKDHYKDMMKTRGRQIMQSMSETGARVLIHSLQKNIIILDVDQEVIIKFSKHENLETIKLVYNPPCSEFPEGHYDVYKDGEVIQVKRRKANDDDEEGDNNLLYSAIATAMGHRSYIIVKRSIENPHIFHHSFGEFLASEYYARQLKRGRALLRFDMKSPTTQLEQSEHLQLVSVHLVSCIEQALKSDNASQLAEALAKYESELRSAEDISPGTKTKAQVSRDACQVFLSSGHSVEADVFRRLVVEKINDGEIGDITKALQLCFIGHQTLFDRNIMGAISSTSDPQTLENTFEQMNKCAWYKEERTKFLSVCDEWYKVLEPQGLMNIEQSELLRKWIMERQYANAEDSVVSQVIEKCSIF